MFDLDALHGAQKKAQVNQEKNTGNYDKELFEAMTLFFQFEEDQEEATLKKSASKFFAALRCKRNNIEPYLYLSIIFYLFDEEDTAKEYFETAETFEPENPELVPIKEMIYGAAA